MHQCGPPTACSPESLCGSCSNISSNTCSTSDSGCNQAHHTSRHRQRHFNLLKPLSRSLLLPFSTSSRRSSSKSSKRSASHRSSFEATGHEDIRSDLAHYGYGSVNWCNLVALGERVHRSQLKEIQQEPECHGDWAGEPAWQDDFTGVAGKHAKRMHYHMEWTYFGGQAVAHVPDELWWCSNSTAK